jgi:hypothetical protein
MSDLTMVRSDTFTRRLRIGTRNQTADDPWIWSDFTTLRFTIRRTPPAGTVADDTDAMLSVGTEYFDIVDDEWVRLTIPASMTNLEVGNWYWDIQGVVDRPTDVVKTLDNGRIRVEYDISRSST